MNNDQLFRSRLSDLPGSPRRMPKSIDRDQQQGERKDADMAPWKFERAFGLDHVKWQREIRDVSTPPDNDVQFPLTRIRKDQFRCLQ